MKYYSTRNKELTVRFRDAVLEGLAPDGGLYLPERLPVLDPHEKGHLKGKSLEMIAYRMIHGYVTDDIPSPQLTDILADTLCFPLKLVEVDKGLYSLELYHGPTAAFKDFGARFLARCMEYFLRNEKEKTCVLVATSGDTGSAVANGFLGMEGIEVLVLFPSGQVSPLQEQQMTTLGKNIRCLEVDGSFDDCQEMVKQAFNDKELRRHRRLSSANSINIARLLPQTFYYAWAWSVLGEPFICSVPSGNFGNLTAGLIARTMGIPISRFIAATNINKIVPEYLESGTFSPRPSLRTLSNAMDVGNPSNFERMEALFKNNHKAMQSVISGFYATDRETLETLRQVRDAHGYTCDPHGAIGYRGLKPFAEDTMPGVFLETAHPAKFRDQLPEQDGRGIDMPERLQKPLQMDSRKEPLPAAYEALKEFILHL